MRTAAVTGLAATGAAGLATPAQAKAPRDWRPGAATFRWFGTAGWRIDIGARTVLVDPYLSRYWTGLFDTGLVLSTPLTVATATVDANVGRPETILVTHSHWDHFNDVPHIAIRTKARVLGTMTTYQLGLASGIPVGQLGPVKGGEVLDFGDYTVEVAGSLHSRNASYSVGIPGVRLSPPPKPATVGDLPEGDTLAYLLSVRDGPAVFFMGASDFVARNVDGMRPDIAMVAMASATTTHEYVPRLLEALGKPPVVVPVHWDNFEKPLENPPPVAPADRERLDAMITSIRRVAPRTRIVLPDYLKPYTFA
ncbi:L-ascorbate metabolism protein UlaG, beta-lactamase superfamily [Asanoa hainanensis]|uniref:L-ascorbate metabolism protein UlaG, beta-lactamase superfamily n=1 Tax=Asanoa hainanensis TaxID=560556 RepID=A0A239GD55_9ACTN|nr:MBL fold metallo-hydrolase [Asanoa hainanensis]SNS66991.1 L-ascorbate metabolism protein UlaG, beta-lactamase superfamily [Asanoa hainanensis]